MIRLTDTPKQKSRWLDASRVSGRLKKCPFKMRTKVGVTTYYRDNIALLDGSTCKRCPYHLGRKRGPCGSNSFEVHCAHP